MQNTHLSHQRMVHKLDKFGIKLCLSLYFSLPAKFKLVQSRIFAPIRAHWGGSTTLIKVKQNGTSKKLLYWCGTYYLEVPRIVKSRVLTS